MCIICDKEKTGEFAAEEALLDTPVNCLIDRGITLRELKGILKIGDGYYGRPNIERMRELAIC